MGMLQLSKNDAVAPRVGGGGGGVDGGGAAPVGGGGGGRSVATATDGGDGGDGSNTLGRKLGSDGEVAVAFGASIGGVDGATAEDTFGSDRVEAVVTFLGEIGGGGGGGAAAAETFGGSMADCGGGDSSWGPFAASEGTVTEGPLLLGDSQLVTLPPSFLAI
ncbi:hypothetical protein NE237_003678 [Protea cynaroides]|uniref:Uncharacterized protein n=1 Tax=Protea cynaroides TaxID=273540 RepID=A0A9Q0KHI1_9MAGN|nr:hypothetical protein NE237_003678 [Protea cynaroides]